MQILVMPLAAVALVSAVGAQKYTTAPAGYETKAATAYSTQLGSYETGRQQFVDGSLRGTALLMTGMDFRLDVDYNYSRGVSEGRSWTNVTVALGAGDYSKFGTTFSTNQTSAASQVFNSKVAWPKVDTKATAPAWGKQVAFPFSVPYNYTGKTDLITDFVFRGGKLDNGGGWASSAEHYRLDHVRADGTVLLKDAVIPPGNTCADSSAPPGRGALTITYSVFYGKEFREARRQQRFLMSLHGYTGAANSAVIQAVAWGGSVQGVDIGARCNRLHLDLSKALGYLFKTTDARGNIPWSTAYPNNNNLYIPYDAAWAGQSVWVQSAWEDKKFKQLSLTAAMRLDVSLPGKLIPKLCTEAAGTTLATTGKLLYRFENTITPRFAHR